MTNLSLRAAHRRDRLVLVVTLIGLIVLSWAYQLYLANDMNMSMDMSMSAPMNSDAGMPDMSADAAMSDAGMTGMDDMSGMDMNADTAMSDAGMADMADMSMAMPMTAAWTATDFGLMFVMWAVMMAGMMLPSLTPTLLAFTQFCYNQQDGPSPLLRTILFMSGYLAAWTAFSAVAVIAQWLLHNAALISPMMVSTSAILGGVLFVVTGIFQWTPLKHACLRKCRTPLGFFMTEWRGGLAGAFVMGLKNGQSCIGCCWLLMALLFVAGVMNLLWVAAIAAFVLLEKIVPRGEIVARVAGVIFVAFGVWMLAGALI